MNPKTVKELLLLCNVPHNANILDIGCGNGDIVWKLKQEGLNIRGIDVEFKEGIFTEALKKAGDIRTIITNGDRSTVKGTNEKYSWPLESDSITMAFSSSVIEHVANIEEFAQENARVLEKGGLVFHYFPSRTSLVEAHTGIPFGGIIQNYFYYKIACKLVKTRPQYLNDPQICLDYMTNYTHYRSRNDLKEVFKRHSLYYIKDYSEKTVKNKGYNIASKIIKYNKVAKIIFNLTRSNLMAFVKK